MKATRTGSRNPWVASTSGLAVTMGNPRTVVFYPTLVPKRRGSDIRRAGRLVGLLRADHRRPVRFPNASYRPNNPASRRVDAHRRAAMPEPLCRRADRRRRGGAVGVGEPAAGQRSPIRAAQCGTPQSLEVGSDEMHDRSPLHPATGRGPVSRRHRSQRAIARARRSGFGDRHGHSGEARRDRGASRHIALPTHHAAFPTNRLYEASG